MTISVAIISGPMEETVGDFLEMAIQENTSLIVMLTNSIELGKVNCIQS